MLAGSPLTVERGGSQTNSPIVRVLQRLTNRNVMCNNVLEHERGSLRAEVADPVRRELQSSRVFHPTGQITAVVYPVGRKTLLDCSSLRTVSATPVFEHK